MATRRSCSTRSHATTGSCPANSSRLSSKTCMRRRPENDSPQNRSLAARPVIVPKSAPADPASRRLAVSIVRHHVEPRSPSQTVSESLRPRLRREPDHALLHVPCIRSRPDGITRSWPLRANRQRHSLREKSPRSVRPFRGGALRSPRHHSETNRGTSQF
jgi:hypothetical protein